MDVSKCLKVDASLKDLKLLSRRLHTLLNTHATELQFLQRLYYKNKNQHRGSLFWRKVVEIRRYSERLNQHKLHISIDNFRCTFYGPGVHKYGSIAVSQVVLFSHWLCSITSLKGPWTHFPDASHISSTSNKIKDAVHLLEKVVWFYNSSRF